jgi:hypothetical protein
MATRAQVLQVLDGGDDYAAAGRALGIPPGLARMIATGRPGDRLVGPPVHNPLSDDTVHAWLRDRAARELKQP